MTASRIRVRVAGLVFHGDELLVVEQGSGAETWACYPGGEMEPGETPEAYLARELLEELQLRCTIHHLAGVGDFVEDGRHSLELFFKCSTDSTRLTPGGRELRGARFMRVAELGQQTIYPVEVTAKIPELLRARSPNAIYFGRFS